jgi:hypothetical protein
MDTLYEALTKKFSETHQIDIGEHYQDFKDLADYVNVQFSRKDPSPSYDEFQKEVLKQSWEYFEKKFVSKIDSSRALDFVDSYDTHRQSQTNALKGLYQHTGYGQERQEMKSLTIDIVTTTATTTGHNFTIDLDEPIIIDKLSNVYLDSIMIFKGVVSTAISYIIVDIEQFQINSTFGCTTSTHTLNANNKIIIPNDITDAAKATVLKGKKFNYVAQINPTKLTRISGKITGVATNATIPASAFAGVDSRALLEFLFVATDKMSWK